MDLSIGLNSFGAYFLGNTLKNWLIFLLLLCAGILLVRFSKTTIFRQLKAWADISETDIDDLILSVIDKNGYPYLYYLVFLLSSKWLVLASGVQSFIAGAGKVVLAVILIRGTLQVLRHLFETRLLKTAAVASHSKELSGLFQIVNVVVWAIGLLLLLDNFGVKISTLVAGMGIGGVAVALAAQAVLGDLFAYFAILLDKPFEIGDFIVTGEYLGTVEHIGIKTTRLRSLSGEQIIFSNSDLIASRPRNYKRMEKRRVLFKIGVTYDTPKEIIEVLPGIIKGIITSLPATTFDRSHFSAFSDSSLDIETVYYVENSDYTKYMDLQQTINLRILEQFRKLNVDFAFPSRTVYLKQ